MVDSRIALQRRPSGVGISGIGQFSLMMMLIVDTAAADDVEEIGQAALVPDSLGHLFEVL